MADYSRLAREIAGSVHADEATRWAHARDGSIYQIEPEAVVRPGSRDDVVVVAQFAAEIGATLHARGAASGRAGGALGPGIVVDFRNLTGIDAPEGDVIQVEPGAVYAAVNQRLAAVGRHFAPDPSSGAFCTIGGMVGNNASGPHTLRFGSTRNNLADLEMVLADGALLRSSSAPGPATRVRAALEPHADAFTARWPAVSKCSSGYDLPGAWNDGDIDLARLFCGSEGTLGLVTRAWLRTEPLPAAIGTAVACFGDLGDALAAVPLLVDAECAAVELMDDVLLDLVREHAPEVAAPVPADAAAILIVEVYAESAEAAGARLASLDGALRERGGAFLDWVAATDDAQRAALWEIRKASSPLLDTVPGTEVLHVVEDVCVPLDRLAEYAVGQKRIFAEHGLVAAFFGHAGNGNLHLDPLANPHRDDLESLLASIMEETYAWVLACDGVITAEHGDGILRTPWVAQQFPHALGAFRAVKHALDPDDRLNPGKIVTERTDVPDLRSLRWRAATLAPAPDWLREREARHRAARR